MPGQIRRVVTGHDDEGRAIVLIDERVDLNTGARPGVANRVIWTTEGFPVDNHGSEDAAQRPTRISLPNGTIFRIVEFHPGNQGMVHRTETIDYAVVLYGEIDMELEAGEFIHMQAGDVLVQRGTLHNWVNTGTEPCAIAFILIDAKPVTADGRVLGEEGVPANPWPAPER